MSALLTQASRTLLGELGFCLRSAHHTREALALHLTRLSMRARTAALGSPRRSSVSFARSRVVFHARHLDVDVDAVEQRAEMRL